MEHTTFDDLTPLQKELVLAAEKVMVEAFNPVSRYQVGAAVATGAGQVVTGTNLESVSHHSLHAETSALTKALTMGLRDFVRLAVIARLENAELNETPGPCGNCRQYIYEISQMCGHDIEIIMSSEFKDKIVISSISELLPMAFGPKDLGIDLTRFRQR